MSCTWTSKAVCSGNGESLNSVPGRENVERNSFRSALPNGMNSVLRSLALAAIWWTPAVNSTHFPRGPPCPDFAGLAAAVRAERALERQPQNEPASLSGFGLQQ